MKEKSLIRKISTKWIAAFCAVVVVLLGVIVGVNANDSNVVNYSNMTIQEVWEAVGDDSLTYVFTGDSITHNTRFTQGMNSYSDWFEQYLYDTDRTQDSVINAAWGGADTRHFLTDEEREAYDDSVNIAAINKFDVDCVGMGQDDMVTKYNPAVVFIKLGMNDRGRLKDTEEFKKNYTTILDGIYATGEENGKAYKRRNKFSWISCCI